MKWSSDFAYAIGLFVADGHLSINGRHLAFTSKEIEQIHNFKKSLGINNKIVEKSSGYNKNKKIFQVNFGNVRLYKFIVDINIPQQKTRMIKTTKIPERFFPDFLRGFLDGDGSIGQYCHPETSKDQVRIRFTANNKRYLEWLHNRIIKLVRVEGGYIWNGSGAWVLTYCKRDSLLLINYIYYSGVKRYLSRKAKIAYNIKKKGTSFSSKRWQNR